MCVIRTDSWFTELAFAVVCHGLPWLLMLPFLPEWINGSSECLQEGTNSTFEDSPKCWSKHECAR